MEPLPAWSIKDRDDSKQKVFFGPPIHIRKRVRKLGCKRLLSIILKVIFVTIYIIFAIFVL